jgi:hypothetical protein
MGSFSAKGVAVKVAFYSAASLYSKSFFITLCSDIFITDAETVLCFLSTIIKSVEI